MLSRGFDRRDWLKLALATASAGWAPRAAWSQPRLRANPFEMGVASGSPTHDSVVLWTRLAGDLPRGPVAVRWEVAHDEAFARIAQRGEQQAVPELAHSVHAEVAGLEPDRWYFYRFMAGDALSTVGRTRTLPAPDAAPARLRLAYASCQRWEHGYFSAWRHMLRENLDAVLFLGDYIYEYPLAASPVRIPTGWWTLALDDYRARYALYRSEQDLQAMHAACPWFATWDDHEVQNDYAGLVPGDSGPRVPDFAARRAAAYQAFYEHMPVRAAALSEKRVYAQHRFGKLAGIVMLDSRQYRDAQACNPGGKRGSASVDPQACASWEDPKRSLLGAAQEQWLDGVLAQGGATWTVVGQQTLFGQRDFQPGPGRSLWNDGWDGYPAARRRFTESLLKNRVANPVLLGGDVHENWVGHLKADYQRPDSAPIGVEFCGTSITSRSGGNAQIAPVLAENPHFVFADAERKGYGVVEFTPSRLTTTLRVVDDVTKRDTRVDTLATFTVEAGRQRVEAA
ncbi:alkaline phosphatase D family protein [Ramlibacter sp. PS4R-6]|uniref:alkaline phosphatase D family protein n=1 Tax=Ramlibacter sp. PS4R-6 TaxID=3133438 RepID=UPI0030AE801D